ALAVAAVDAAPGDRAALALDLRFVAAAAHLRAVAHRVERRWAHGGVDVDGDLGPGAELRAGGPERVDRGLAGDIGAGEGALGAELGGDGGASRLELAVDLGREGARLSRGAADSLELGREGRVDRMCLVPGEGEHLVGVREVWAARRRGRGRRGS